MTKARRDFRRSGVALMASARSANARLAALHAAAPENTPCIGRGHGATARSTAPKLVIVHVRGPNRFASGSKREQSALRNWRIAVPANLADSASTSRALPFSAGGDGVVSSSPERFGSHSHRSPTSLQACWPSTVSTLLLFKLEEQSILASAPFHLRAWSGGLGDCLKTRAPFEVIGAADGARCCCMLCGR
jgi:hypothetical protein